MDPASTSASGTAPDTDAQKFSDGLCSNTPTAHLVATSANIASTQPRRFFRSVQWTADGTSLVALSDNDTISTYILPADLLAAADADPDLSNSPLHDGSPYGDRADCSTAPPDTTHTPAPCRALSATYHISLPEPSTAACPAPYFSLVESWSHVCLVACRDHPLQLRRLAPDDSHFTADLNDSPELVSTSQPVGSVVCSYRLIRRETETYIHAAAISWPAPGTHFLVGSANRIDLFDTSRPAPHEGPVTTIPTIPSRRRISKGHGLGMKGIVSALAPSPPSASSPPSYTSLVAAGTWTRWVGLYDLARASGAAAVWSLAAVAKDQPEFKSTGCGVAQLLWSPCSRYLVVNERGADALLVYDIRSTGRLLCALAGRSTRGTQQRMTAHAFPSSGGCFEMWAGCVDGTVLVWDNVGAHGGVVVGRRWAAHQSPIGAVALHPVGSVLATASGGWDAGLAAESASYDSLQDRRRVHTHRILPESVLKLWELKTNNPVILHPDS